MGTQENALAVSVISHCTGGTLQILLENHRLHNLVYPTKRKIIFSLLEIATRSEHRAHKRVSEHTRQLQVSRAEAFSAE